MGSHYSQCFATRQTIAPRDKCYVLAIRQQATYSPVSLTHKGEALAASGISHSAIYPDAYWTTVGNFLEARYEINGDVAFVENDENFRRLLAFTQLMLKNAAVTLEGENTSHDLPYDFQAYVEENCPALQKYLQGAAGAALSDTEKSAIFHEMAAGWSYTDDVAFKHRVFYMDQRGNPRPLQFTMMHGKCYDALLEGLSPEYTPEALADQVLEALDERKACGLYSPEALARPGMHELATWIGPQAIQVTLRQLGEFDSIRYNEAELGFGEFGIAYLAGTLTKAKLRKLLVPLLKDRLVMHMLESYEIKISPKSIRYEDDRNHIGQGYADLIAQVGAAVTKSRKRAPRY